MHAVAHSLAHRAPPATRARVRWQPYNPIPSSAAASSSSSSTHSSSSSISSPITSLHTPDSSVSSPHSTPPCDIEPLRQPPSSTLPPAQKEIPPREPSRSKHALGLVDQAVKSLCEIWRPQDIPSAFLSSTGGLVPLSASLEHTRLQQQPSVSHLTARSATQLPPAFPTAPSVASTSAVPSFAPTTPAPSADSDAEARSLAVPIKGFVHEVLRRSRTSGHVLQTALCYLEAIRPKIPELANKEKTGEAALLEAELESRIVPATEAELAQEQVSQSDMATNAQYTIQPAEDVMDTIRVSDSSSELEMPYVLPDISLSQTNHKTSSISAGAALPRLPTPLLCPRRAFLAALILASKFTQDKCYSNRAWAKLSGLPAREIGRCERALGDALDWRLWVGKSPTPPPPAAAQRPMARSSSEATLFKSAPSPVIACERKSTVSTPADDAPSNTRRLRKCVTLPAEAFSTSKCVSARSRIVREKFLPSMGLPYDKSALPSTTSIPYERSTLSTSAPSIPGFENFCPSNMKYPSSRSGLSEKMNQSPSPDTPGLTYSPSSTESCSGGDRTIQMSTFLDDNMGNFNPSQSLTSTESWQYLEDMANFNAQAAMGQGQTLSEKKMDFTSAPQIYIPSDSPPSMFMTSLDTLLSKPGPYGPDMRGSYPHEMTGDYLTMGLSD